ncbi:GAF domain-containing protein [Rhizobium setariae]|uniref:GAF domain-containing protein n=1 Tax=Rhizobium setariae TaxID=2801340 RepID=UPI001FEF4FBD|nr:GAF domain-containing protein [Rhizobium setariae]
MPDLERARAEFDAALGRAEHADQAFAALQALTEEVVGAKLFTVMTVDMAAGVARRAYSSDARSYPASGTKPIHYDAWFKGVSEQRVAFVANTLADIAKVFPDYELIGSLGCGSVINLPIFIDDVFVCTVNMLHEEHYYTEDRVALAKTCLVRAAEQLMRRATKKPGL